MNPNDIRRLTKAARALTSAQHALTATKNEVNGPTRNRACDLEELYERDGLSEEDQLEVGRALKARLDLLLTGLWQQEDVPCIRPLFDYPHKEVKIVRVPGYVDMHLTRFKAYSEADIDIKPEGHIELTDPYGYWGLAQNDHVQTSVSLHNPRMHAWLEDDASTLEGIYDALAIPLPEQAV